MDPHQCSSGGVRLPARKAHNCLEIYNTVYAFEPFAHQLYHRNISSCRISPLGHRPSSAYLLTPLRCAGCCNGHCNIICNLFSVKAKVGSSSSEAESRLHSFTLLWLFGIAQGVCHDRYRCAELECGFRFQLGLRG